MGHGSTVFFVQAEKTGADDDVEKWEHDRYKEEEEEEEEEAIKTGPMHVPTEGVFYQHDNRLGEGDEEQQ